MNTEIIVAVITAISSITVAIIQYFSTQKQFKSKLEKAKPKPTIEQKKTVKEEEIGSLPIPLPKPAGSFDEVWWWVGGILFVDVLIMSALNFTEGGNNPWINMYIIIPFATLLLSFFRPALWGYVATFVTVLHLASFIGLLWSLGLLQGGETDSKALRQFEEFLKVFGIPYIFNAVLCAIVSYVRLKQKMNRAELKT